MVQSAMPEVLTEVLTGTNQLLSTFSAVLQKLRVADVVCEIRQNPPRIQMAASITGVHADLSHEKLRSPARAAIRVGSPAVNIRNVGSEPADVL